MNPTNSGNRFYGLDVLKAMALLAIVLLHSASGYLYGFTWLPAGRWWTGNIIDSLTRWGVPVFIMVTGALLLGENKTLDLSSFYKKRFSRIMLPFLFYSCIYAWFKIYDNQLDPVRPIGSQLWEQFYKGNAYYHIWYMYMLIGLFIVMPLLDVFCKYASDGQLKFYLLAWVFSAAIINFFPDYVPNMYLELGKYSGYLVLGYVMFKRKLFDFSIVVNCLIFILSSVFITYGTYIYTGNKHAFDPIFYVYLSPVVMLQSLGIFGLVNKFITEKKSVSSTLINNLSRLSLGIYLLHVLIMDLLAKGHFGFVWSENNFLNITDNSVFCIISHALIAFVSSWLVINLCDKIPVVRRLVN